MAAAKKSTTKKSVAKKTTAKKAGARRAGVPAKRARTDSPAVSARALMRGTRQSPYKMRLVIDQIRGKDVNEALALLTFSKKHAAVQISKTLKSAVANAEQAALKGNSAFDVDSLYVKTAIVNMGQPLKRFTAAAQGRATPIRKRTSHVELTVAARKEK